MLKFLRGKKSTFMTILIEFISIVFVKSEPIVLFPPKMKSRSVAFSQSWGRLHLETHSALLAPSEENPRITIVFP